MHVLLVWTAPMQELQHLRLSCCSQWMWWCHCRILCGLFSGQVFRFKHCFVSWLPGGEVPGSGQCKGVRSVRGRPVSGSSKPVVLRALQSWHTGKSLWCGIMHHMCCGRVQRYPGAYLLSVCCGLCYRRENLHALCCRYALPCLDNDLYELHLGAIRQQRGQ